MENTVIQVRDLKKNFGKKEVLKGINMDIRTGEVIGYLGTNGAGKSTTVKILCGILHDFTGEVKIFGDDLRTDLLPIKQRIGYIPENAIMYEHLTPLEYLEFIGSLYGISTATAREKSIRLLNLFEMQQHQNERMTGFSKGMKQKVHIISGLLHNPDILFMDEPLSGLDANSVIIVKEMITQLAHESKTIFYCSHLMDVVEKVSNRIILINDGLVAANGSVEELKHNAGASSLETLFSKLTGAADQSEKAEQIINAFETK